MSFGAHPSIGTLQKNLIAFTSHSLCWGPHDQPQVQWFARSSHGIQHAVATRARMHYSERIQSKPAKETVHEVKSGGNQAKLPRVPSWVTHRRCFLPRPPAVGNVAMQGSSLETPCPEILLGVDDTDTFCLACAKVLVSQRESRCSV